MNHDNLCYYSSFVFPVLLVSAVGLNLARRMRRRPAGMAGMLAAMAFGIAFAAWPVRGLPLGRYLTGFNANFSITLLALLLDGAVRDGLSESLLGPGERRATLYAALIVGIVFYPTALGWGNLDPYVWGWRGSPLFAVTGLGAAWLIWRGNRCGLVLLAAVAAWSLGFLESRNYWDYLLDPVLFLCGVVAAIADLFAACFRPRAAGIKSA
jgi:hypothetical protein